MSRLTFRNVQEDDAAQLLEIYRYYVEKTAISFEWTVPTLEEFRNRIRRTEERYPYIAAVEDDKIIGYSYASPFVGREAYSWSCEMTIYLNPKARHQGVGKKLYYVMEEILKRMHITNLYACIGWPKEDDEYLTHNSAGFHEHLGYRMAGKFNSCGYKFGKWYDMVWMEKMIGGHPKKPEPVLNYNAVKNSLAGSLLSE